MNMGLTISELKSINFFENYNDNHLRFFSEISSVKEFKVKDILFEQYDQLSDLYLLLEGTLSLGISLAKEKRIHLSSIQQGQLFSWSAVFEPYISTAWVMATGPAKVLAIDSKKLQVEFKRDCEFGFLTISKIARTISNRLSDTRFHLMNQLTI
jgi:CRP/FNR family transcriptional regulator